MYDVCAEAIHGWICENRGKNKKNKERWVNIHPMDTDKTFEEEPHPGTE